MRKLPRQLAGFHFPKLFAVEMNDFDPEMILPGLFYLIRSRGRERSTGTEATDIGRYARVFAEHQGTEGFDSAIGLRVAEKWSRTSFARVGGMGRSGTKGEQITYLRPLSFLTYKPAFPAQSSRHRNVHRFLFDLMFRGADEGGGGEDVVSGRADTEPPLAAHLRSAFSRGIRLSAGKDLEAYYDGVTRLDTEVLASMYYTDGFEAVQPSTRRFSPPPAPVLPQPARALVRDVSCFVAAYAARMPTLALAKHLTALLSLELAAYTLRLIHATNQLVYEGEVPHDMRPDADLEGDHLEVFCDTTEDRRSQSAQIAGQCVARDLEAIEHFFGASLKLRTLDRFVESFVKLRERLPDPEEREGPEYIIQLPGLVEDVHVEIAAGHELQAVSEAWRNSGDAERIPQDGDSDFARLMEVLTETQRKRGVQNYTKWFWSVCGIESDCGILAGSLRHRTTWRYMLSHSLLETLVQLCVVLPEYRPFSGMRAGRDLTQQLEPMPVLLSDFLRFVRERFGILIDRPPTFRPDSEAIQAAGSNLRALKERLRQMGLFVDLSDDFNAQYIYPRFRRRIRDLEDEQAAATLKGREDRCPRETAPR